MRAMEETPQPTPEPSDAPHGWARPGSADDAPQPLAPPPAKRGNAPLIIAFVTMLVVLIAVVAGLTVFLVRDTEDGSAYPVDLADEGYDLDAMVLRNADVPEGIELVQRNGFDNEEWAALLVDPADPEALAVKVAQLNAQERIRTYVAYFSWPEGPIAHLGQTLSITAQSTLFATEAAAEESLRGAALCGLILNEAAESRDFRIPAFGDASVGFFVTEQDEQLGTSVDTVLCFRTGRIVHGLVQSALDGAQDIGLIVRLGRRMLGHIENAYDGVEDPLDEFDDGPG